MLEKVRERLQAHRPRRLDGAYPQAAVLLPIVARPEPTLQRGGVAVQVCGTEDERDRGEAAKE